MSRYLLWVQLRAAVREGNTEEAEQVAKSLGYLNRRMRKQLLERIWKQHIRKVQR